MSLAFPSEEYMRGIAPFATERCNGQPVAAAIHADLGIGQITGRVFGPGVACELQGPYPGIAGADVEMDATAAAPANGARYRWASC